MQHILDKQGIKNATKNLIYFVGDGISVATTAGRIFKEQMNKKAGEEIYLVFESFSNLGMAKTYNIDKLVLGSAAIATALFTFFYKTLGLNLARENSTEDDRLFIR